MLSGSMINLQINNADTLTEVLRQRIQGIMLNLRARHPWPHAKYSEGGYFRIPINIGGRPHNMPLGFVGSRGCSWARSGGCTMCDYGGFEGNIPDDLLIRQAVGLLNQWPEETEINLSSLGSFFDDRELSPTARYGILAEVARRKHLELIGVESRADDISAEKIRLSKSILGPDRCLEVGMGLESVNDFVRNVCINKGLKRETFERAVKIIRVCGAHAVGHVLFKPPFLTEREAIEDAKATIEYLNNLGVRRIVLMACNVKEGTLVGELYRQGLYRPPWLWSILETMMSVSPFARKKLLVYGFKCGIPMLALSNNCRNCDDVIIDGLENFCGSGAGYHLDAMYLHKCICKSNWKIERNSQALSPLPIRTLAVLRQLELGSPPMTNRHYNKLPIYLPWEACHG